jgi:hypothetical protein
MGKGNRAGMQATAIMAIIQFNSPRKGQIVRRLENSRDWIYRNKAAAFASEGRLHWLSLIYLPGGAGGAGGFGGASISA